MIWNKIKKYIWVCVLLAIGIVTVSVDAKESTIKKESVELNNIEDAVYDYIYTMRIEHPRVVMAQCILETGNFSSDIFLTANNCFGMKLPAQRPTLAVCSYKKHAKYNSWKDCICDYAIWQSIYARNLTEEEYLKKLDSVYAEDKSYSKRLREIMNNVL